jgi:hypothetical protein
LAASLAVVQSTSTSRKAEANALRLLLTVPHSIGTA